MAKNGFIKTLFEMIEGFGFILEGFLAGESFHYLDLRVGGIDPHKIYKGVENLKKRKIVRSTGDGRYVFTTKGKKWIKHNKLNYFKYRFKQWDHKWRVVLFDIPQEKSLARQKFRRKLLAMGFHPVQKSVFVFPYPCQEEIAIVADNFKISDYIDIFIAEFPGFKEAELLKFFKL